MDGLSAREARDRLPALLEAEDAAAAGRPDAEQGLLDLGFNLGQSETPILPVYCRDLVVAFKMCKRLQEEGLFVNPVVSPAVAPGEELIRLSLMATHTDKQVDFALDKLGMVGREFGLI